MHRHSGNYWLINTNQTLTSSANPIQTHNRTPERLMS